MAKLNEQDKAEIIKQYACGYSASEIAKKFKVSHTAISKILKHAQSCKNEEKVSKSCKQNNYELAKQIIDKAMSSVVKDIEKASPMDRIKIVERLTINGTLTGFGCKHTTTPYKKGNKPINIPKEVIERQRVIESRQRELERKIRLYETRALGWRKSGKTAFTKQEKAMSINAYKHNHKLVKKWQEEYIAFSKKNNVPYYPSRLKV